MQNDSWVIDFYNSKEWRRLRREVLKDDKNECLLCKMRGFHIRATVCHHVNHLRKHPELALEKFYVDDDGNIKRNLVSRCKNCHEVYDHPERMRKYEIKEPLNLERWD